MLNFIVRHFQLTHLALKANFASNRLAFYQCLMTVTFLW